MRALSTKVGAMLANSTLGTGLEFTLITGAGFAFGASSAFEQKGAAHVMTRRIGTVTGRTDLTLELKAMPELASKDGAPVPMQLQLRYTRPDGESILRVWTAQQPVCKDRSEVEANVNGTCIALNGVHSAACLAQ